MTNPMLPDPPPADTWWGRNSDRVWKAAGILVTYLLVVLATRYGEIREHHGDVYSPRRRLQHADTIDLWERMYHRARRSKTGMTFRQAEALFLQEHGYYPPRSLPLMPREGIDWYARVADVPRERLRTKDAAAQQA